jgi:hypothetical protein
MFDVWPAAQHDHILTMLKQPSMHLIHHHPPASTQPIAQKQSMMQRQQ